MPVKQSSPRRNLKHLIKAAVLSTVLFAALPVTAADNKVFAWFDQDYLPPHAVAFNPSPGQDTLLGRIVLWDFAHNPAHSIQTIGLRERRAYVDGLVWQNWRTLDVDLLRAFNSFTSLPERYPVLGWIDEMGRDRVNGFAQISLGLVEPHSIGTTSYNRSAWSDFAFNAQTGVTWRNGNTSRLNLFGNLWGQPGKLHEYWWDGTTWRTTDHGDVPLGMFNLPPRSISMGQYSSYATLYNNLHVWMALGRQNGPELPKHQLAERWWNGSRWQWRMYEAPEGSHNFVCPPVAFYYSTFSYGGALVGHHHHTFVVSEDARGDHSLWEWSPARNYDWFQHPLPNVRGSSGRMISLGKVPFKMTAVATWMRGDTPRACLFGYILPNQQGVTPALLTYVYDGTSWRWETPVAPPNGWPLQSEAAVAIDGRANDRVSVFLKTRAREIYERRQRWVDGVPQPWEWITLSP